VRGVDPAKVTGRLVQSRALLGGEIRIHTQASQRPEQRLTEQFVRLHQVPREVVGRRDDGVRDVPPVVVVDGAAAGLASRDRYSLALAERPVDRGGVLVVPQRERARVPTVHPTGTEAVFGGGAGSDLVEAHLDRTGP